MERLRSKFLSPHALGVLMLMMMMSPSSVIASTKATAPLFTLLDQSGTGTIRVPSTKIPTAAVITSPGTKGSFYSGDAYEDSSAVLACDDTCLVCRGAQLKGTSDQERTALATTSLVASVILVDGITLGDVQDLANGRHARTLTALFRTRLLLAVEEAPQTLLLGVQGELSADQQRLVLTAVNMLFEAVAVEKKHSKSFQDLYNVQIVNVEARDQAQEVRREKRTGWSKTRHDVRPAQLSHGVFVGFAGSGSSFAVGTSCCLHTFVCVQPSAGEQGRVGGSRSPVHGS